MPDRYFPDDKSPARVSCTHQSPFPNSAPARHWPRAAKVVRSKFCLSAEKPPPAPPRPAQYAANAAECVSGRCTRNRRNTHALKHHLFHHRHQHGHAQIFERPRMAVAALLDHKSSTQFLGPISRPKQIATPFVHRHHIVVVNHGADQFFFSPHRTAIRPLGTHIPLVEQPAPIRTRFALEHRHIVGHLEQPAARWTSVNHLGQRIVPRASPKH